MLTRRGWMVAIGSVVCTITGRMLGIAELFGVGVAMIALVAASAAYVRLVRYSVNAVRQLHPARVHSGVSSRVDLTVRNAGRPTSPVLAARDPFDGGRRWARFSLPPPAPGESARAAYRLPTEQRGISA